MDKFTLKATKRTITGRKIKQLRTKGILPANIYGKKVTSTAIQVDTKEFSTLFSAAGETTLVELLVDSQKHPVLIHNVAFHPVTGQALHVDFLQVDLKEKVTTKVPLHMVGEAIAVKDKVGTLLTILSEIEIQALPADLPDKIDVDISSLAKVGDVIKVSQLLVSDKIKIITPADSEVLKVASLISKEAEQMAKEAEAAAAAATTTAAETTAAPATTETAAPAQQTASSPQSK